MPGRPIRLRGFSPVADRRSRALILGTFPGPTALRRREYFAHPQNQFWRIMAAVLGRDLPESYERRLAMLLDAGIALWDVVESCERQGALDASIRDPLPADIPGLLRRYPRIKAVFVTGRTGELLYGRFFEGTGCPKAAYLPSPSPANAGLPLERKASLWKKAIAPALRRGRSAG